MLATPGIEWSTAIRASVAASHVLLNGHFTSASTAEHRWLGPFHLRPDLNRVTGQCLVTLLAGEIDTAALHLDGNHIESGPIVSAPSLCIQIDSANLWARELHGSIDYRSPWKAKTKPISRQKGSKGLRICPIRRPGVSEKMAGHPYRFDHRRPNLLLQTSRCILPPDGQFRIHSAYA